MPRLSRSSPFSADDHIDYVANQSIGALDASYRAAKTGRTTGESGRVRHVAVRDASGSFTNEEAVHTYMMPSKYLKPSANTRMAPKRPLGARRTGERLAEKVPMYSQVATFGAMERVRRPRMPIAVTTVEEMSLADRAKRYVQLVAALGVAAALFITDKVRQLGRTVAYYSRRLWAAMPLVHANASYSAYRGVKVKRLGMDESRFRVVSPVALVLFVAGFAVFSSLVGENLLHLGGGKGTDNNTSQNNSVSSGSDTKDATKGGRGGGNPQPAAGGQQAQNQASGTAQPAGGVGGGSAAGIAPDVSVGGGVSGAPTTSGGAGGSTGGIDPAGVTIQPPAPLPPAPSIPLEPSLPPVPSPPPAPDDPVPTLNDTVQSVPETLKSTVQNAPQLLDSTVQSAPKTLNDTVQSVPSTLNDATGSLGL